MKKIVKILNVFENERTQGMNSRQWPFLLTGWRRHFKNRGRSL